MLMESAGTAVTRIPSTGAYAGIGLSCCHHCHSGRRRHRWTGAPRRLLQDVAARHRPAGLPSSSSCAGGRPAQTPRLAPDTPHLRNRPVCCLALSRLPTVLRHTAGLGPGPASLQLSSSGESSQECGGAGQGQDSRDQTGLEHPFLRLQPVSRKPRQPATRRRTPAQAQQLGPLPGWRAP